MLNHLREILNFRESNCVLELINHLISLMRDHKDVCIFSKHIYQLHKFFSAIDVKRTIKDLVEDEKIGIDTVL
jgi:hypothetical protein